MADRYPKEKRRSRRSTLTGGRRKERGLPGDAVRQSQERRRSLTLPSKMQLERDGAASLSLTVRYMTCGWSHRNRDRGKETAGRVQVRE